MTPVHKLMWQKLFRMLRKPLIITWNEYEESYLQYCACSGIDVGGGKEKFCGPQTLIIYVMSITVASIPPKQCEN